MQLEIDPVYFFIHKHQARKYNAGQGLVLEKHLKLLVLMDNFS